MRGIARNATKAEEDGERGAYSDGTEVYHIQTRVMQRVRRGIKQGRFRISRQAGRSLEAVVEGGVHDRRAAQSRHD